MSNALKVMLVLALCVATAAFAQNQLPANGSSQTPTYPDAGNTKGVNKFGTLPSGAVGMGTSAGFALDAGQQFNSKWNMVNGNHDLTSGNTAHTVVWSNSGVVATVAQSGICAFCHTAHDNEGTADRTWLWAHDVPQTSAYGVYSSPTLQAGVITFSPNSATAKCMGCHDGTIAVTSGAYGTPDPAAGNELTISSTQITSGGKLVMSSGLVVPLNRTHPVGFTYNATLAAKHQLRVPGGANSVDGYGIVPLFGAGGDQMECATCHDPHLKTGIMRRQFPTGATQDAGTGSFCLYCHL
ncbi:MAG TPA: hypothetical protein VMS96_00520 [Terriglobales bacterium]|nr:hypothetical protein [Terriglobales bacterium]